MVRGGPVIMDLTYLNINVWTNTVLLHCEQSSKQLRRETQIIVMVIFLGQFCPRGKGAMRLTLHRQI